MSSGQRSRAVFSLIANALADPQRYEILKQIARQREPLSFAALQREHDIGAPTMSYHLKRLAEANLINVTRHGTHTTVALRPDMLRRYLKGVGDELGLS
jgi:ArsR family transcriptional regulator